MGYTEIIAMEHLMQVENGLGPVELGHRLGIRSASATALVDRLEAAGHVRRSPHPQDRRRVIVKPTQRSRAATLAALTPLIEATDAVAADLTAEEAAAVTRYLRRIAETLREFSASR